MEENQSLLTSEERKVINLLIEAWNAFHDLEVLHSWDAKEFMYAIHLAQLIVLSRPVKRQEKEREV